MIAPIIDPGVHHKPRGLSRRRADTFFAEHA